MGAPLISNLGFTEVNSSGSLNTKAGAKINLPIQLYKLTDNISGQLELSSTANHKKIILDTNGFNIENTSAPLNLDAPSGVEVEIKGNGSIKSTNRTFTIAQASAGHTGTSTAGVGNTTQVVVDTNHIYTNQTINDIRPDPGNSYGSGGGDTWGDNAGKTHAYPPNNGSNRTTNATHDTYYNTSTASAFGGPSLTNVIRSDFRMTFTHAFMEDGNRTDGPITGVGGSFPPTNNTTHSYSGSTYRWCRWYSAFQRVNNGNSGPTGVAIYIDANNGNAVVELENGRGAFCQIRDVECFETATGRKFTFTNNTDHTLTLTGTGSLTGMATTVNASASTSGTKNSTNGSYSITATIPETDGLGNPLSLLDINEGDAILDSSQHTGITSVKAF